MKTQKDLKDGQFPFSFFDRTVKIFTLFALIFTAAFSARSPILKANDKTGSQNTSLNIISQDNSMIGADAALEEKIKQTPPPVPFAETELLGIRPGTTTLTELQKNPNFKKPILKEVDGNDFILTYQFSEMPEIPFVRIVVKDNVVTKLFVHFQTPRQIKDARASFINAISGIDSILIPSKDGNFAEIYPERGFSFIRECEKNNHAIPSDRVIQIVVEKINAEAFIIRAASHIKEIFNAATLSSIQTDAENALRLDPNNPSAHWFLAKLYYLLEDYKLASHYAMTAIREDPKVPQYQILLLNILNDAGLVAEGSQYLNAVAPSFDRPPFFSSELNILRGDLLRQSGSSQDPSNDDEAMEREKIAIETLFPFLEEKNEDVRLLAKTLTVRANLVLAKLCAQRNWEPEKKEEAFDYLETAANILADLYENEHHFSELYFDLALAATEIGLELPESPKTEEWINQVTALAEGKLAELTDPLEISYVNWKCGKILFNAFIIADLRGDEVKVSEYASRAFVYLDPFCQNEPERVLSAIGPVDYEFGLFFHSNEDLHQQSVICLKRAADIILQETENENAVDLGEQGIRLVNIGKAFWGDEDQDQGLQLTRRGAELIEKGVQKEGFDPNELTVPYQNLIIMLETMGDTQAAGEYKVKLREISQNAESNESESEDEENEEE